MAAPADRIPFRWPRDWQDPALLELFQGTPVNCLVMEGEAAPVAERARAAGMEVVTLPAKWWTERSKPSWQSASNVLAFTGGVWPAIPASPSGGDAGAGPTGMPWVDSNGWFAQLARARAPGKTIWLAFEPPEKADFVRAAPYLLAVADSEAYGARWVVSLDPKLRAGLASKQQSAVAIWKRIAGLLSFFRAHRAWDAYRSPGVVAVLSDFEGQNQEMSWEILNLLGRRSLPFRILEKAGAATASFGGLRAILYPDREPPSAELRKKLTAFVTGGGLLIAGPVWGPAEGAAAEGDPYGRYEVRAVGNGRLAIAREEPQDPYQVAADTHLLLGRRHDVVRVWNAGSMNSVYTVAPGGNRAVVQVVNYATRPAGHPVSIGFAERYRTVRLWTPDVERPAALDVFPTGQGVEVHLPPIQIYAAIELEK